MEGGLLRGIRPGSKLAMKSGVLTSRQAVPRTAEGLVRLHRLHSGIPSREHAFSCVRHCLSTVTDGP